MEGINCQIFRNPVTNEIEKVVAKNGETSNLYQDAVARTGNKEEALDVWSINYINDFQEFLISNTDGDNKKTQTVKRESGQISEIHQKLEDFIGGYEETIRTNDTQGSLGENFDRNKRESVAIVGFAKSNGFFIENLNERYEDTDMGGAEADIYLDPSNHSVVIKDFSPGAHNGFQGVLGRILMHNMLFPETRYEIVSVSQEGQLATLVLQQPFVEGGRNATQEEIVDYVEAIGFEVTSAKKGVLEASNDEGVILGDLHDGNLLVKEDGTFHLIDPMINYVGAEPFYNFINVTKNTERTIDENNEATIETVLRYIAATNAQNVKPMTGLEEQTVKNMLMSLDIENSEMLNKELLKLFPEGQFSTKELQRSKVFNALEKEYITQNKEVQENLQTLSQQLSNREDVIEAEKADENFVIYTNNKNKYGKIEVQNPAQIKKHIKQKVGAIKNREEFEDAFNSLPYRSIVEKFNSNSVFATHMFEEFSDLKKIPVQKIENGQVKTDKKINRTNTVKNTANLEKTSFSGDIDFLNTIPNELWGEQEVEKALESLEKKGVAAAIDLEGLADSAEYKTQEEITAFLGTLSSLEKEQTKENLQTFLEAYTEFFDVQEIDNVSTEKIVPEHSQKTLRRVENSTSEYNMFNGFSLVKIKDGVYQLVTKNPNERMYNAMYAQVTRGESRLPKKATGSLKKTKENKPTITANIKNFVSGLISGENKIPNKVVNKVNPKIQAQLVTEYLKEKLGYDINILPTSKVSEELARRGVDINPISHNEKVYGFHDPKTNQVYLTEEYLTSESLIHEMSHAYFPVIRQQAAQGDKQAQLVLDKMEASATELLGEDYINDRYESINRNKRKRKVKRPALQSKVVFFNKNTISKPLHEASAQDTLKVIERYTNLQIHHLSPTIGDLQSFASEFGRIVDDELLNYDLIEEETGVTEQDILMILKRADRLVDNAENKGLLFQVISEKGAQNIEEYHNNLLKAKELKEKGVSLSDISDQTGWYYFEGDWRMFSNEALKQFKLNDNLQTNTTYRLDEVLDPKNILFTLYPSIADVTILLSENESTQGENNRAEYNSVSDNITLFKATGSERKKLVAHELQHAIQKREGLPNGGSGLGLLNHILNKLSVPKQLLPSKDNSYTINIGVIKMYLNHIKNESNSKEVNKAKIMLEDLHSKGKDGLYPFYRSIMGEIDAHAVTEIYEKYKKGNLDTTYEEILTKQLDVLKKLGIKEPDITTIRPDINNILSSSFAYDPRQGESLEEYKARMIDEAIAVIMQKNSVEYFEKIAEENGLSEEQTKSFLQQVKEFVKQFSKWLFTQFGIDTVTEDTTNKELYDAVTTSMLRGDLTTNSPTLKKVTGGNVSFSVQEGSYDTDTAENLLLNKLYFKNPIQPETKNNVELHRNEIESFNGNYEYLSSDYLSDFQSQKLKERDKNSEVYEKVYSQFEIDDKGIKPKNTDDIYMDNLRASINELLSEKQYNDLKNYAVVSRNQSLKELFVDELRKPFIKVMSQERIYYQNNIEALKPFTEDYQLVDEASIATKEAGQSFIRINNSLYEKAQDAAGYSFYRQIETYSGDFNVIKEQPPVDKFAQEYIKTYLAPTETVEKINNLYTKEELGEINEENFNCSI